MTPMQKIKATILQGCMDNRDIELVQISDDAVDDLFDEFSDITYDEKYYFREGEFPTPGICQDWSRHYETEGVAAKMFDGSYVGWTYWSGGGRYGEPESEPWMETAYELDCIEEEKLMIVRTFSLTE